MRHLLKQASILYDEIICVNGYIDEYTNDCYCYPGWTSDYDTINRCDIDSGENRTRLNDGDQMMNSQNNDFESISIGLTVLSTISLMFCILAIIIAILLYLYKKYKNIKKRFGNKSKNNKSKKNDIKRNEKIDGNKDNIQPKTMNDQKGNDISIEKNKSDSIEILC